MTQIPRTAGTNALWARLARPTFLAGILGGALAAWSAAQTPGEVSGARSEAAASHARRLVRALQDGLPYVPDELLVRFAPGSSPADQASALGVLRADIGPLGR